MQKVAVASSDGITIDVHFGQARRFLLYEVEDDGTFIQFGEREIPDVPSIDEGEHHDTGATARALIDVDAVLARRIGPGGVAALKGRGVKGFAIGGSIEKALPAYGKRYKLLELNIPGISGCSSSSAAVGKSCGCSTRCK
jgi:nitrogen fixation protein NifX